MKSSITFWLATVLTITSTFAGSSIAQESGPDLATGQALVQELLQIRDAEFVPLQQELSLISSLYYAKQSGQSDIVRKLKELDKESLHETRNLLNQAEEKLASLKTLEQHLLKLREDDSLKDGFIKTAEETIEKIKAERTAAQKPVNAKSQERYTANKAKSESLKDLFITCLKEKGTHELMNDTELKYSSYDPSYARFSTSFHDEHGSKLSLAASLAHSNKANEKLGKFLDKYPIVRKSSWGSYTILVGASEVSLTFRIREWDQKKVEAAAADVIDFEKLAKLNPVASK